MCPREALLRTATISCKGLRRGFVAGRVAPEGENENMALAFLVEVGGGLRVEPTPLTGDENWSAACCSSWLIG